MKGRLAAACAVLLTMAQTVVSIARAEPPAKARPKSVAPVGTPPARRHAVRANPKPVAPETPQAPPADVKLMIEAPAQRGPWTMRLSNDGEVPVTVAADARLLSLDVTPRSARKAQHCELPGDMRPNDPLGRSLVIPPHREYVENFEPRLFCFSGKALDALSSGAIVVARLGRPGPVNPSVAVVMPADNDERPSSEGATVATVSGRSFLEAPPIVLPDEEISPRSRPVDTQPGAAELFLDGAPTIDAESSEMVEIPLTLKNEGSRPLPVRFRPEMLTFDVVGPSGVERCSWPTLPAAPLQEMFTTLPAKSGITHLTVMLGAYCLGHVLDEGGLLAIWPRLDTRHGSAQRIGLRSFDGQVAGSSPTFVRLHRGRVSDPLVRPRLEEH